VIHLLHTGQANGTYMECQTMIKNKANTCQDQYMTFNCTMLVTEKSYFAKPTNTKSPKSRSFKNRNVYCWK